MNPRAVPGTLAGMTATTSGPTTGSRWYVPTGLILLSAVPVLAGAVRVSSIVGGAEVTAANARFMNSPVPVVAHVIGATVFCVLGAFQFVPSLRRRRWHRIAGRVLVPCGLIAALSGVWMALFYDVPDQDRGLLTVVRLVVGSAMAAAIVLAFRAIRRGNVVRHSAWMTRGYALGIAAGTQAVIALPLLPLVGETTGLGRTLHLTAGWLINIAVAEWVIRRRATLNNY
jgi:uncharacterized membrane protein